MKSWSYEVTVSVDITDDVTASVDITDDVTASVDITDDVTASVDVTCGKRNLHNIAEFHQQKICFVCGFFANNYFYSNSCTPEIYKYFGSSDYPALTRQ